MFLGKFLSQVFSMARTLLNDWEFMDRTMRIRSKSWYVSAFSDARSIIPTLDAIYVDFEPKQARNCF